METNAKPAQNNLPWSVNQKLKDLEKELSEGILTEQGYEMKKKLILDTLTPIQQQMANKQSEVTVPPLEKNNFIKNDQKIKESNDVQIKQIPNKNSSRKTSVNGESSNLRKPSVNESENNSRKPSYMSSTSATEEGLPKILERTASKNRSPTLDIDKRSIDKICENSFGQLSDLDLKEPIVPIQAVQSKKPKQQSRNIKYDTVNDNQKDDDNNIEELIDHQMKPFVIGPLSSKVVDESSGTMMSSFSTIVAFSRFFILLLVFNPINLLFLLL